MDVRLCAPRKLWPADEIVARARTMAKESGARILLSEDPKKAVKGCDFLHTDVWVSMGEPAERWAERIKLLKKYRVTAALMKATGNPRVKFMHCLPAFHNRDTTKGEELFQKFRMEGLEVAEDVFESPASVVFDQAENRMHTIKAIL